MISGILICDAAKCKGTLFEQVYVTNVIQPAIEEDYSINGKCETPINKGQFFYRCIKCGKKYDFHNTKDDFL